MTDHLVLSDTTLDAGTGVIVRQVMSTGIPAIVTNIIARQMRSKNAADIILGAEVHLIMSIKSKGGGITENEKQNWRKERFAQNQISQKRGRGMVPVGKLL